MIPDIRKGVLCVEKAADCLDEFEKEAALTAKQEEKEKNKEVSFTCAYSKYLVNCEQFLWRCYK